MSAQIQTSPKGLFVFRLTKKTPQGLFCKRYF
jgi:hypothetical protein